MIFAASAMARMKRPITGPRLAMIERRVMNVVAA